MAFSVKSKKSGTEYFLHAKMRQTSKGEQPLYYFAKEVNKDTALDALPDGREVSESSTGLPVLKKKAE